MKKKLLILLCCLIITPFALKYYYLKHPIKMFHPKIDFEEAFPVFHTIDRWLCFTADITWYEATEVKTGKKYLLNIGDTGRLFISEKIEHNGWYGQGEWKEVDRDEYLDRFNSGEEVGFFLQEAYKVLEGE